VIVDEWINNFVMTPQQMNHNNNEKQTLSAEGDGCFTAGIRQIWAKPCFDARFDYKTSDNYETRRSPLDETRTTERRECAENEHSKQNSESIHHIQP